MMAKLNSLPKCDCSCDDCCCRTPVNSTNGSSSVQANGAVDNRPFQISCEWDRNKTQQFSDDGTNTFFWHAHTITVLIGMLCVLVYVALFEEAPTDTHYNTKRGLFACAMVFLLFGVTQIRDSSFKRPHPAFWRLMICLSVIYELALIYILFQSVDDARQLLRHLDDKLGKPLPETLYCQDCSFYTPGHPDGAFHNFLEKCDFFVFCHVAGWWCKAIVLRDWWLCTVISVMFEVLEYTLEHQLPNFCECWWDHWIMDFLVCNGLGTYLGMKTCDYLAIKPFHWRGLYNISSYKGKLKRVAEQFTPYSWTPYHWGATRSLKYWLGVCGIIAIFLTAELNTFYLKFILWLEPPHIINFVRAIPLMFCGCLALNETYEYMHDKNCKRFGQQAWVVSAIIATEVLVCLKFGWNIITVPFPKHVVYFWALFAICWLAWTVWHFWPGTVHSETNETPKHVKNGKKD